MIRIGLVRSENAFLPENAAYKNYFENIGGYRVCEFDSVEDASVYSDLVIFHCGVFPFWRSCSKPIIMEYHSLSTTKFPKLKNILKRIINRKGDGYIFLNDRVREGFLFSKKVPHRLRGMGYNEKAIERVKFNEDKDFDFIYMGTTSRTGVKESILSLAELGFSIAIVGNTEEEKNEYHVLFPGVIFCFGKMNQEELFSIASRCRFGLNYTPDIYPLNIQDSTKVIEYCALGLNVVTNYYQWVRDFENSINASFLDIDELLKDPDLARKHRFSCGDVVNYSWDYIISSSGIESLIKEVLNR